MPVNSQFAIPTLGMKSQAHAISTIGNNVANVATGGYRRTDTRFSTLASRSFFEQNDIGGVQPKDFNRISVQGVIVASASNFDVSINGKGYFVLNTNLAGSGDSLYTRDGGFSMATANPTVTTWPSGATTTSYEGYLVDKNGYYVQGYPWDTTTSAFTTTLGAVRIDENIFATTGSPTTTAELSLNLPSTTTTVTDHAGSVTAALAGTSTPGLEVFNIDVIDSAFAHQPVALYFSQQTPNNWSMSYVTDTGVASATTALTFDSSGQLTAPAAALSMGLTFASAATGTVALDLSKMVQFAGSFTPFDYTNNGFAASVMKDFNFGKDGQIIGNFLDNTFRPIFRLPVAEFTNPDLLDRKNGNVFEESTTSGSATLVNVGTAGFASFSPNSHELSNVDIADEFTKLIMTQAAYNASANVFKTVDEMMKEASRLKR